MLIGRDSLSRFVNRVLARILTRFDLVIACGPGPDAYLAQHHPGVRRIQIDNGVEVPAAPAADERGRTFVVLAAYRPEKRHDRAIRAFLQAGLGHEGWRLRVVGPGVDGAPSLQALIPEGDISISLEGPIAQPEELLGSVAALVISSDVEGLSLAGLEALAQGTPVVATDVGGNHQLVVDPRLLVAREDESGLASALRTMAALDEAEYASLREQSHSLAVERFSLSSHARKVASVYRLIAKPA